MSYNMDYLTEEDERINKNDPQRKARFRAPDPDKVFEEELRKIQRLKDEQADQTD